MKKYFSAGFAIGLIFGLIFGCLYQWRLNPAKEKILDTLAQNIATVSDDLGKAKKKIDLQFGNIDGRIASIQSLTDADRKLLYGLVVPPPPAEIDIPPLPLPSEPTFETVPQKKVPKAKELPSSEPKQQLPDLLVQANQNIPWTHAFCSCGKAHKIIGWTTDEYGHPSPIYGPCRDEFGSPACSFRQFMVE